MTKQNLLIITLLWLCIVGFTGWVVAQNKINYQERIIEIDNEIAGIDEEIAKHKKWYDISIEASKECEQSFIEEAEKEHLEAEKKRELKAKLEKEKKGLLMNR